ncbi:MAG: hypothetical protein RL220_1288 [Bacteroidota bacterium]
MFSFRNKRILIISPEGWGRSFLSKHHYAQTLAESGAEVWFLAPGNGHEMKPFPNLKLTVLFHEGTRGLRHIPRFLAHRMMRREARQIESITGGRFDVVWSFDSSRLFDLSVFDGAFRIYHMVDERNDFNLSVIASTADICLAVTSSMVSRLSVHNRRSYFVQHGHIPGSDVDVALPAGKNKIRALYAGNLRMQFLDWELIGKVVRSFPDVDFYFVGSRGGGNMNPGDWPVHPEMLRLHEYPNVILTGEVDYAALNSFMQQSDILLLMYDAKRFPDEVANSHKILSYLSSGKVVVATYTREYDGMGLLEMATDQESYMSILKEVADNKDAYNNPALMSKRMSYANEHTYMKQLTRIEELISKVKS